MKSEWNIGTISEVCSLVTDGSHYSPKSCDNGEYMVSVKDFKGFGFDFSNCKHISSSDYEKMKASGCIPECGDILIGKDGARFFEDIIIYNQPEKPALLSSIAILRCNPDIILPQFLYYICKNPVFKKDVRDNYGSGSAIPRIVLKDFKRMPISYPDLDEQRKIVASLVAIDDRILLNTAINENLESQAQAIFKDMIADVQEQVPFTSIIQVLGGGTPKTSNQEYWNGEIPFFTPKDTGNPYVLTTEKSITPFGLNNCNSRLYPVNTVFLTARGTVGKVSLAGVPMSMNQSCYALVGKDGLHQIIVYHYVLETVKALKHKASGAVFDAIITRDFDTERVPVLSSEQINGYIAVAEPIYSEILNRTLENERLAELRDTLLPKLMNGEIDVSKVRI